MKNFLIISCLMIFNLSFSQIDSFSIENTKGLSIEEFLKAKDDYFKLSQTDLYKSEREASLMMIINLKNVDNVSFMKNEESFFNWINENLALTKFETVEEAVKLRKLCNELSDKIQSEYSHIFSAIKRATVTQAAKILAPDRLQGLKHNVS